MPGRGPNPTDLEILAGLRSGEIPFTLFEPPDLAHPVVELDCGASGGWEQAIARAVDAVATCVPTAPG